MTHTIYIALGSNLGDRYANLLAAIQALPPRVRVLHLSPIYETAPWGYLDQPEFLNMVLQAETDLSPKQMMVFLKEMERRLGRQVTFNNGPRVIDLDLLFYDDLVLEDDVLTIPHTGLAERAFVLVPLADLAPDFIHPVHQQTVTALLSEVDTQGVRAFISPTARMDSQQSGKDGMISRLVNSGEASIHFKTRIQLLGQRPDPAQLSTWQESVKSSPRVQALLCERNAQGEIPRHPYAKWKGAHWVLSCLAEIGYPPGDRALMPLLEQVYDWLLSPQHLHSVKTIAGRARRCASQEGNAVYYALALGLEDERTEVLVERLLQWQWSDGGWNCDKNPQAINSSFHESLIPMRALILYGRRLGNKGALQAAERAAEIFLKRELFRRRTDGAVIHPDFALLHYPYYWRYNILHGLIALREAGWLSDPRCQPALELLQSKQLPEGGFPAEKKYYRVSDKAQSGASCVDWGPTSKRKMNEFVTLEALLVLEAAGAL